MLEFSLKQLEVFATVARVGSFTRAAQELYLTQSTVSAHIQALEHALGGPLFQRNARRQVCLTWQGESALPVAREILDLCRTLEGIIQPYEEGETLHLAASTVPAQCLLPGLMAGFSKKRPGCRFRLRKGDSDQVHRLLEEGSVAIGFAGAALDSERFLYEPVLRDRLVLITANTPRFRTLRDQGALGRELLGESMLCREAGSGTRQRFDAYLTQIGIEPDALHVVAQIDQPDVILGAVASGLGVSVCSALVARDRLEQGSLFSFELEEEGCCRSLYLVTRRDHVLTDLETCFCRFVREGDWDRPNNRL